MSADLAWYIQGPDVYAIHVPLLEAHMDVAEQDFLFDVLSDGPEYEGISHQDAKDWAFNNYAEHGVMFIEEDD